VVPKSTSKFLEVKLIVTELAVKIDMALAAHGPKVGPCGRQHQVGRVWLHQVHVLTLSENEPEEVRLPLEQGQVEPQTKREVE
jgi:hypothetical protein